MDAPLTKQQARFKSDMIRHLANGSYLIFNRRYEAVKDQPDLMAVVPDIIRESMTTLLDAGWWGASKDYSELIAVVNTAGFFAVPASAMPKDERGKQYFVAIQVTADGVKTYAGCHKNEPVSQIFSYWAKDTRPVAPTRQKHYIPTILGLIQQASQSEALPLSLSGIAQKALEDAQEQLAEYPDLPKKARIPRTDFNEQAGMLIRIVRGVRNFFCPMQP